MSSKAETTARERLKAAGNMGIRVGSDLHLCEMLLAEIDRLRAKAEWADEASELMYNFATGKDDGAAIIAHVRAKLELL